MIFSILIFINVYTLTELRRKMYKNEQDSSTIAHPLSNVMLWESCSLICAENNWIINKTLPKKKMTLNHTYISAIIIFWYICWLITKLPEFKSFPRQGLIKHKLFYKFITNPTILHKLGKGNIIIYWNTIWSNTVKINEQWNTQFRVSSIA